MKHKMFTNSVWGLLVVLFSSLSHGAYGQDGESEGSPEDVESPVGSEVTEDVPPVAEPDPEADQGDHYSPGEESVRSEPEPPQMSPEPSRSNAPTAGGAGAEVVAPAEAKPKIKARPVLSEAEKRKICSQFEGKFISFYSDVYLVKHCVRLPLSSAEIYEHTRLGKKIEEVARVVIEALTEGADFQQQKVAGRSRSCQELEGKYITYQFGDIYLVKSCKRRVFLDWASFETHRGSISLEKSSIHSLTWDEYSSMKIGPPMPSAIIPEYAEIANGRKAVDVIPIDEACKGVNGRYVTYYSRIYKIEKCYKREIDSVEFTKWAEKNSVRLVELTSEQWLSLPDGLKLAKH